MVMVWSRKPVATGPSAPVYADIKERGWHRLLRYGAVQKLLPGVRILLVGALRRQAWLLENLTIRKAVNTAVAAGQFLLKSRRMAAWPVFVKIDITPLCNLSCTVCVHADPNGNPALEKQEFKARQRMPLEQYRRIIEQIQGQTSAVSLYFLGDPLLHPNVDEMCRIARDAGLNVHISTNFSFSLTDERIRRLVRSGLTHMTVCVDGLSQEAYQRTRVGGRIDRVILNLDRVCRFRREYRQCYPRIEVQYLKFQHNSLPGRAALCLEPHDRRIGTRPQGTLLLRLPHYLRDGCRQALQAGQQVHLRRALHDRA